MKKRLLSILTLLTMAVSLFGPVVLAQESFNENPGDQVESVEEADPEEENLGKKLESSEEQETELEKEDVVPTEEIQDKEPEQEDTVKLEDLTIHDKDGNKIEEDEELIIKDDEKVEITAIGLSNKDYQWQISNPNSTGKDDEWIDIQDETEETLKIDYALIKNVLVEDATEIRVRSAEDKEYFSESIIVRLTDEVEATEGNSANKIGDVNEITISYLNQLPNTDDSEPDIYGFSVQTYYINEDGEEVKLPSIIEGQLNITDDGSYEATAEIPEVAGYKADLDNMSIEGTEDKNVIRITDDKKKIELKIDNLTRDLIIKIKYIPTEVKFTVEHYQQKVADDEYTKHKEFEITEHKTGTSIETIKDKVDSLTTTYEGFYQLPYNDKVKIAADGSTTIQIKYDRDYSLINFVLGQGGYGVEPIYGRYDAEIGTINNPTRSGYEFVGWTTNEAEFNAVEKGDKNPNNVDRIEIKERMPATNITYYALWEPVKVNYTVMYWYQNANPNDDGEYDYSFLSREDEKNIKEVEHGLSVIDDIWEIGFFWGSSYQNTIEKHKKSERDLFKSDSGHFTYNAEKTNEENKDVEFAPDGSTVINIYYDRNTYNLIFNLKEGTLNKNGEIYENQYTIKAKYEEDIADRWPTAADIKNKTLRTWVGDAWSGNNTRNTSKRYNLTDDLINKKFSVPQTNTYFSAEYGSVDMINLNYYIESVIQEEGPGKILYRDRYYEKSTKYSQEAPDAQWNPKEILGLDIVNKNAQRPKGTKDVNFYYNRKEYPLYINNYFEGYNIDKAGKSIEKKDVKEIKYGKNIKQEEPNIEKIRYPEGLEKNAYEIDREKPFITKDGPNKIAFNFDTEMPNRPLNVYVNWVRKNYELNFYDSNDMADRVKLNDSAFEIEHGSSIKANEQEIIKNKLEELKSGKYDGYEFVGWFYEKELRNDDGTPKLDEDGNPKFEEKAYDFNIPLTQDSEVYAKWTSNVLKEYNVQYLYNKRDDNGELIQQIPIAKPIVGQYKFAGETHTENVKTGRQLNEGYQSGYFPTKLSQSLIINKDGEITDNGEILSGDNVITFEYEKEDTLDYLVRYLLEDENGELVKDTDGNYIPLIKTKNNTKYYLDSTKQNYISENGALLPIDDTTLSEYIKEAETSKDVITERPERAPGYKPDSYTKRLILRFFEKDEENPNEIIFRYQSTDKALVNIRYFKENPNGSEVLGNKKYSEFGDEKNLEIDYNSTETFELTKHLLKLEGFMLSTVTSFGEKVDKVEDNWMLDIDKKGLEIKIYYDYENTDLTITKEVTGKIDENQTFVFNVKGDDKNTENIELTVTIHGKDKREVTIKDLPIGEYIVTEQTDWSWRYTPEGEDEIVKAISVGGDNLFEFINKRTNNKWLSGDSYKENKFD